MSIISITSSLSGISLEAPEEISCYTKLENGNILVNDRLALRQLNLRGAVGQDLIKGHQKFIPPTEDEIYNLEEICGVITPPTELSVISQRRSLIKIMKLPFENGKFNVVYWKKYVFIICDDPSGINVDRRPQYSGYRFEDIITLGESCGSFYSVLNHKISNFSVIYSAEVDAVDNQGNYVELKTHAKKLSESSHRRKLLSSWCQNHLGATDKLVIGYRTSNYRVANVQRMNQKDIEAVFQRMPLLVGEERITPNTLKAFYRETMDAIVRGKKGGSKPKQFLVEYDRNQPKQNRLIFTPVPVSMSIPWLNN